LLIAVSRRRFPGRRSLRALARHHTGEQARFYVEHLGADFDD